MFLHGSAGSYIPMAIVGQGATATVYAAKRCLDNKSVCIKIMPVDNPERIKQEIENIKKLHHPHIAELYDIIDQGDTIGLVMEFADMGSLMKLLKHRYIDEWFSFEIFEQTLSALDYLHNRAHIIHRDLKPENILLDSELRVKLVDFGYSKSLDQSLVTNTAVGSPAFSAPEVVRGEEYTYSADIWSLGVCLYSMVTGKLPFEDTNLNTLLEKIVKEDMAPFPPDIEISQACKDLIARMLEKDPAKRITIREIRTSKWFTDDKNHKIRKAANNQSQQVYQEKIIFPSLNKGTSPVAVPRFKPLAKGAKRRFSALVPAKKTPTFFP